MILEELRRIAVLRQTKFAYFFYKEDYDIVKKCYSRNQGTKQETKPERTEEMNYSVLLPKPKLSCNSALLQNSK